MADDRTDAQKAKDKADAQKAPAKTDAQKAQDEALALQAKATEAHQKADAPKKTPEQVKADELSVKADDARAKAAEMSNTAGSDGDSTAEEAKVVLPVGGDPEMPAGDHWAVKRGNDPSNPEYPPKISQDPEHQTVKLSRVTADSKEPIYTWVHPDMVGNYVRAGWGMAD